MTWSQLRRAAATTALAVAGFATLPATPAFAAPSSSCLFYSTKALVVHVAEGEPVELSQGASGEIMFAVGAGAPAQCSDGAGGTTPTVAEIDSVTVDGYDDLTIDMQAPGGGLAFQQTATGEPGQLDDTYFSLGGSLGFQGELTVLGTDGPDDFSARPSYPWGLRLNSDNDTDIGLSGAQGSVAKVNVYAGAGDDRVDVSTLGSNPVTPFFLQAGPGNDVLHGGDGDDTLHGDTGNDELSGGKADDQLQGHENDDTLLDDNTYTFSSGATQAITNGGTASSEINVNGPPYLSRMRVRVTIDHPSPQDLRLTLGPAGNPAESFELAPSLPGTGQDVWGLVFDPHTGTGAVSGNAPYTGAWTPTDATALRSYLQTQYAGSGWELRVEDTDSATVDTGTLLSWELAVVGSPADAVSPSSGPGQGNDVMGGDSGTDTLEYTGRADGVDVEAHATAVGFGQAGQGSENDFYGEIEKVVGSRNDDTFEGGAAADSFDGGQGADWFQGKGGADTLACGDDATGPDMLDYSLTATAVQVDLGMNVVTGGDSDVISGCDSVTGSQYDDTLVGGASANELVGRDGNDQLEGLLGDDVLQPGDGQDTSLGGPGADQIVPQQDEQPDVYDGGDGVDSLGFGLTGTYTAGVTVTVDGVADDGQADAANDSAVEVESLLGTDYDDSLSGTLADETLIGGPGNDTLVGNGGSDYLDGGALQNVLAFPYGVDTYAAGTDTVSYAGELDAVSLDLSAQQATHGEDQDLVLNVHRVLGSPHDDLLVGSSGDDWFQPNGGADTVQGGDGADVFRASSTPDGADVWVGGDDAGDLVDYRARTAGVQLSKDGIANDGAPGEGDEIGAGTDVLRGGLGADTLIGGAGSDLVHGEGGNDSINGRGGVDVLHGDTGDDAVNGGSGNDTVHGEDGKDQLLGGDGDDTLRGGEHDDTLTGGFGDDDVYGGNGNDRFREGDTTAANGSDLLRGEAGLDTVSYSGRTTGVKVSLQGTYDDGATNEQDNASNDVEHAEGTAGSDVLTGSSAANKLLGLGGNDVLNGLTGNDTLDGGTGDDTFGTGSVADGADVVIGGEGVDLADYRLRSSTVRVLLDTTANDGAVGEADYVRGDVENVYGGSGADTLTGSAAANKLYGFGGNDVLTGGLGADLLDGGSGNDSFYAKDGVKDTLLGGAGTDALKSYDTVDVRSAFP